VVAKVCVNTAQVPAPALAGIARIGVIVGQRSGEIEMTELS